MTYLDVVIGALRELGVVNAVDPPGAEDAALGLDLINEILNDWNADERFSYDVDFDLFTLTPNLQPHTIGPSGGTFTVAGNRPVSIDGANIVLNTVSPSVRCPLTLVDSQWWLDQPVRAVTSSIPTDLYYGAGWPLGSIYLWPVPTTAYQIELQIRTQLPSGVVLTDTFTLPPGYRKALRLTLAEQLGAAMRVQVSPQTMQAAMQARARISANNIVIPRIATQDAGMPSSAGQRASYNWRAGWPRT